MDPNDLSHQRARAEAARVLGEGAAPLRERPSAVDNSTLPYFPPIGDQGNQGSCAAWAAAYYYNTFTQAMDEGYDVSGGDYSHICSPGFLYPLTNNGADNGAPISVTMARLADIGCSSWTLKPYSESDWASWPSEAGWMDAVYNRTQAAYYIDERTAEGLNALRQHLANGNAATTGFVGWSNFLNYPSDTTGINNGVWYCPDGEMLGGHAVAIIGYDDNKAYLDHRDGQLHHGAFLMANSWGPDWGVANSTGVGSKGFFWVAYSMFLESGEAMWEYAWYCSDRPHYKPAFYVVTGINHARRGQVFIMARLGIPYDWASYTPFSSSLDDPLPITDDNRVVVDMTDGIPFMPGGCPGWAVVQLGIWPEAESNATVTSADFYSDFDGDGIYDLDSAINVPVTITPSQGWGDAAAVLSECVPHAYSLPMRLEWGAGYDGYVDFLNWGTEPWTRSGGYQLRATDDQDRWGIVAVDLPGTVSVAPQHEYRFHLHLVGPPLTTLKYELPVTPTSPGVADTIACSWRMTCHQVPLQGPPRTADVVVSRFPDVQLWTDGWWARFYVEECAGRVPAVVAGYEDGTYRPTLAVERAAMAVYVARALKLSLGDYEGQFPADVGQDHWAWPWIEAMARAGLVGGYGGGEYRPSLIVNRDAMAVFVARGMIGSIDVPTGPSEPTFWQDVPPSQWAYDEIEYCAAHSVVGGYGGGWYHPEYAVTRDQMAVFVYRAFIQPTGCPVVVGGPAITAVDPEAAGYWGWSSLDSAPASGPGYAYVLLDAVRLGSNLADVDSFFDVSFDLRGPETVSHMISLSSGDLQAIHDTACGTGVPYHAVSWALPADLTPGDYTLVVSVEDEPGMMNEIARQPQITITP